MRTPTQWAMLLVLCALLGLIPVSHAAQAATLDYAYAESYRSPAQCDSTPGSADGSLPNGGTLNPKVSMKISGDTSKCSNVSPAPADDEQLWGTPSWGLYFQASGPNGFSATHAGMPAGVLSVDVPGTDWIGVSSHFSYDHSLCADAPHGCPTGGWTPNVAQVGRSTHSGSSPTRCAHSDSASTVCYGIVKVSLDATRPTPAITCKIEAGLNSDHVFATIRTPANFLTVGTEYWAGCVKGPYEPSADRTTGYLLVNTYGGGDTLHIYTQSIGGDAGPVRSTHAVSMGNHWPVTEPYGPDQFIGAEHGMYVCQGGNETTLAGMEVCLRMLPA